MKSSAHIEVNGVTVFEPIILKDPERVDAVGLGPGVEVLLHPVKMRARSKSTVRSRGQFLILVKLLFSFLLIYYLFILPVFPRA
jgi:hypothetical protein